MKWWLIYVIKRFCPWLWFYKVSSWDGCPGVCHMPCNWDTEVLIFNKVSIGSGIFYRATCHWSVITILMTRSTATWVWMTTDAGWATTACPSSLVDVLPLQVLWLWRRIWKGHWEGQQRWNWYRQQAWIGDESQKMGQGDIFFPLSKSRSDFEMTNKINNDKLKRKLICETPHQNFATSRLWQRLRQRC